MITTRLYYHDSYLTEFSARVVERAADGLRVYLDRTAFYPTSGGQPHDTGEIAGARVLDVIEEDRRIAHLLDRPVTGTDVIGRVDWKRRFDHMQQHSGQHLLSAVLMELHEAATVGFHLGSTASTVDVAIPALSHEQVLAVEARVNEQVAENKPVAITFEESAGALALRRAAERQGPLRVVTMEGLDRSACGGTHVRSTAEIGPVLIRKSEKIRADVRLEFVCGLRAVRRARTDFDALGRIARVFSAPLDEVPTLVEAQQEALAAIRKAHRRATCELARYQGKALYQSVPPGPDGIRRAIRRRPAGALDEEMRALAQGFTTQPMAVFLVLIEDPPSVLMAVSDDSGLNAGALLKTALAAAGGRGGGARSLAQGSLPGPELLKLLPARLSPGDYKET